jgi:hypothetical protein
MQHNFFGEPVPANYDEIVEAIFELEFDVTQIFAMIDYDEDVGSVYNGYTAEIRHNDEENERTFTTMGYADKQELIKDLHAAGITQIDSYS